MSYSVSLIESRDELEPLEREWRALAEAATNPFAGPAWFACAAPYLHEAAEPAVLAARDEDAVLRGVLPLVRAPGRPDGPLSLAGAGLADVTTLAAAPSEAGAVAAAIASALPELGLTGPIDLGRVEVGVDWWTTLAEGGDGAARPTVVGPPDPLPYLELPDSWEDYLASRSRSFRSQIGRKRRALEREHQVTVRAPDGPAELESGLEDLFRLHDARWEERSGADAFGPETREMHMRLARATHEIGWARLLVMDIDGVAAAAWYGWRLGDRMLYYQAGFDPEWGRHSVGLLLLAESVERAIDEGCAVYDMLLGDEGFKSRFADRRREVATVTIAPAVSSARLRASARNAARRSWRRLRASRVGERLGIGD